jgi:hypothetical protein
VQQLGNTKQRSVNEIAVKKRDITAQNHDIYRISRFREPHKKESAIFE